MNITNILWTLQHQLGALKPYLLLIIAIVTILAGLFCLLGGLGFRKTMFVLIGAFCGAIFIASGKCPNLLLAIASFGIGITLALFLQDGFLVLIVGLFSATYGFSLLIHPYVNFSGEILPILRDFTIGVPFYNWPLLLGLIALPFAAKATWFKGTSAVLCSISAASMLLAGAIMLFFFFGSEVVANICAKREIYSGIFAAVVLAGSLFQILLLSRFSSRFANAKQYSFFKSKQKKGKDNQPVPKNTTWRTA
jgi:hypothetical protein